jgi:COMPASS component SWD1
MCTYSGSLCLVAAIFDSPPVLVDISDESSIVPKYLSSIPKRTQDTSNAVEGREADRELVQTTTVATFTPSGDHIIAGTNRGWLNVISSETCETVYSSKISASIVLLIRFTVYGRDVLVNSHDRIIRVYQLPDFSDPTFDFDTFQLEVQFKFQDLVNKLSWNHITFSSTGEFVVASTYMNHNLFMWERGQGSLDRILEGPKEELSVVEWHPNKSLVVAVGIDTGKIHIWSVVTPQKWSALAPDFVEVEENVEYMEREDEFDIQPPEELAKRRLDLEDEDIDVLTMDASRVDDAQVTGFRMPIMLDLNASDSEEEYVAIGTGQFRKKTPGREWTADESTEAFQSADEKKLVNGNAAKANGSKRRRGD